MKTILILILILCVWQYYVLDHEEKMAGIEMETALNDLSEQAKLSLKIEEKEKAKILQHLEKVDEVSAAANERNKIPVMMIFSMALLGAVVLKQNKVEQGRAINSEAAPRSDTP